MSIIPLKTDEPLLVVTEYWEACTLHEELMRFGFESFAHVYDGLHAMAKLLRAYGSPPSLPPVHIPPVMIIGDNGNADVEDWLVLRAKALHIGVLVLDGERHHDPARRVVHVPRPYTPDDIYDALCIVLPGLLPAAQGQA